MRTIYHLHLNKVWANDLLWSAKTCFFIDGRVGGGQGWGGGRRKGREVKGVGEVLRLSLKRSRSFFNRPYPLYSNDIFVIFLVKSFSPHIFIFWNFFLQPLRSIWIVCILNSFPKKTFVYFCIVSWQTKVFKHQDFILE